MWRPIETAPKNGSTILVKLRNCDPKFAFYLSAEYLHKEFGAFSPYLDLAPGWYIVDSASDDPADPLMWFDNDDLYRFVARPEWG